MVLPAKRVIRHQASTSNEEKHPLFDAPSTEKPWRSPHPTSSRESWRFRSGPSLREALRITLLTPVLFLLPVQVHGSWGQGANSDQTLHAHVSTRLYN